MEGPEIPRVMDALRRIIRTVRVASRATEKEIGISGAQLYVLQELAVQPATSVNDLAERTTTHQSSVSAVVSRLVDRGLAVRRPSPEDGRRVAIELTGAGLALVENAPPTAQMQLIDGLRGLSAEAQRHLADLMEAWVESAHLERGPVPFLFEDEGPADSPE